MLKTTQLKILDSSSVDELCESFKELSNSRLKFLGLDLVIFPEDFDHCCYEYLEGGIYKGKFSIRRARRMMLIEQICNNEIDYKLYYQNQRSNKSIIVISELAEFCFIILPVKHKLNAYFRLLTMVVFGRGIEGVMGRFLKNGKEIEREYLLELVQQKK
jgi:hypothetical protein